MEVRRRHPHDPIDISRMKFGLRRIKDIPPMSDNNVKLIAEQNECNSTRDSKVLCDNRSDESDSNASEAATLWREMALTVREKELTERELAIVRRELDIVQKNRSENRSPDRHERMNLNELKELVSVFDGSENTYANWEKQVKFVKNAYALTDEKSKVLISTRLNGKALEWFHSKPEHIELPLDDIFKSMKSMYDQKPRKIELRKKFEERAWKCTETFSEYVHEKVILGNRVPIENEEIIDYLIEGIPNQMIKNQAKMQNFDNLEDLKRAFEKMTLQTHTALTNSFTESESKPTKPTAPRPVVAETDERIPNQPPYMAFVSNLNYDVDEVVLANFFSGMKIVNMRLSRNDRGGGTFKRFGSIEFKDRESLISAISLTETILKGRRIRIKVSCYSGNDWQWTLCNRMDSESNRNDKSKISSGNWKSGLSTKPVVDSVRKSGEFSSDRERNYGERDINSGVKNDRPGGWRDGNDRPNFKEDRGYNSDRFNKEDRYGRFADNRGFGARKNFNDRELHREGGVGLWRNG